MGKKRRRREREEERRERGGVGIERIKVGERTGTREGEEGREREEEGARIYANVAAMRAGVKSYHGATVGLDCDCTQTSQPRGRQFVGFAIFSFLFSRTFFPPPLSRAIPPQKRAGARRKGRRFD